MVSVAHLSINEGNSASRIVWLTTNFRLMADVQTYLVSQKNPSLRVRNGIPLKWFLHWLRYRLVFFTGKPFVPEFPIWFPNEPDNADPGEECVTFHAEGKLRDVPCFYNLPFLCEKHLDLP